MMLMWAVLGWKSLSIQNEKLHLVAQIRSKSQIIFFLKGQGLLYAILLRNLELLQFMRFFFAKPVHYREVENGVKSSRPWQIISLWMFTQKFQKFSHSSLNSNKNECQKNIFEKKEKIQKTCLGCLLKSRLVSKNQLAKRNQN